MAFSSKESDFRPRRFRNPDVWAALLLSLAWLLFFSDFLFTSKNFYFRDILNFHYPLRKLLIQFFERWEFPLWNPFIYLGQPMLANPNYMAFYPTNLLHAFLSFNYAFKLHFVLHPLLGGLGAYFLQRRLGILPMAASAGSLIYQFSGTVLSFLNLYNIVPAVGLLPWIGWAFLGALEGNRLWRALLFGMILGLQIIAFEPLIFQCDLWLIAGLALFYILQSPDRPKARTAVLRTGLVGGLFALAVTAVQIIPTLELISRSARGAGFDLRTVKMWSMHPADLLNVIVPNLFGNPYTINYANYWGESYHGVREPYLVSFYLGAAAILLASVSFLSARKKLQTILVSLTLISLVLALGRFNPLYDWLYEYVPVFRLGRYPSKLFLLGTLTLAIMGALGFEAVLRQSEAGARHRRHIVAMALFSLALGAVVLGIWIYCQLHITQVQEWIRSRLDPPTVVYKDLPGIQSQLLLSIRWSGVFLLLAGFLLLVSSFWKRSLIVGGLFMVVLTAELVPSNLRLSPLISEEDVDFVPEVNTYLERNGPKEPYRVVSPALLRPVPDAQIRVPNRSSAWLTLFYRMSGQPMYGITRGIQYSLDRTVDHLNTRDSEELRIACALLPEAVALTLLQKLNSPMVLMLGEIADPRVRPLTSFDTRSDVKLNVYWLENTLSRAYFVSGVELASSHKNALERFLRPGFPAGTTVVLEDSRAAERPGKTGAGTVTILEYHNRRVLCQVDAKTSGYLVLLDSYYPGWRAYLDGNEVQILQANYAFRAVEVMEGEHQVEFRYRPQFFYIGLSVTCLALLFGIFAINFRFHGELS